MNSSATTPRASMEWLRGRSDFQLHRFGIPMPLCAAVDRRLLSESSRTFAFLDRPNLDRPNSDLDPGERCCKIPSREKCGITLTWEKSHVARGRAASHLRDNAAINLPL